MTKNEIYIPGDISEELFSYLPVEEVRPFSNTILLQYEKNKAETIERLQKYYHYLEVVVHYGTKEEIEFAFRNRVSFPTGNIYRLTKYAAEKCLKKKVEYAIAHDADNWEDIQEVISKNGCLVIFDLIPDEYKEDKYIFPSAAFAGNRQILEKLDKSELSKDDEFMRSLGYCLIRGKHWDLVLDLKKKFSFNYEEMANEAAYLYDDVTLIKNIISKIKHINKKDSLYFFRDLIARSAQGGNYNVFEYIWSLNTKRKFYLGLDDINHLSQALVENLAKKGDLETIKKINRLNKKTALIAAQYGFLDIFQYAEHEIGNDWQEMALTAALNGHLHILKYIEGLKKNFRWTLVMGKALLGEQWDIIEYAAPHIKNWNNVPHHRDIEDYALIGSYSIIKYMADKTNIDWESVAMNATTGGYLDLIWLAETKTKNIDWKAIANKAEKERNMDVYEYATEKIEINEK